MSPQNLLPIARMFLTSAWLETLLYGINCVLFGGCICVLVHRRRKTRSVLFLSCAFHMAVSTAHVVITLLQLLRGFTDPSITATPNGSDMYFLMANPLMIANSFLYVGNIFVQDLLLIWRLYIVWGYKWKVVVVPLLGEAAHVACAVTSVVLIAQPNMELFSPLVQGFGTASWSLDVIINTAVTCGIAYRLWRAGREIGHSGAYKSTIFTVIESGALIASCTIVIFSLDIAGSPAGFIAINVAAQIATTTPLMIVAHLGINHTPSGAQSQSTRTKDSTVIVTYARPAQGTVVPKEEVCTDSLRTLCSIPQITENDVTLKDVELGLPSS